VSLQTEVLWGIKLRIRSITVRNFRAVREVTLSELTDAVVVAGPNGCGKSSIFDAIRFLKSAYGNYVQNEYAQWFNEFNINVNNPQADTERLLFDPTKPLSIDAEFEISNPEREFLRQNSVEVYRSLKWSLLSRRKAAEGDEAIVNPATKRADGEIVEQQAQELSKALLAALDNATHRAALTMKPGDTPSIAGSPVLELVFSVYRPNDIGVIDYQSPTRVYDREQIGGINLRIQDASQKNAQSALYNTQSKYTGVKTEMAQSYVMEVLAEKAGVQLDKRNTF
jgi:energy-coupling factor transporter ATP-binding protein EcfA2